jgi:uncharacterized protein (DUF1697 family)
MPRYAAFLRGVMPTNATMPELKKAFEAAGFSEVRSVLSSGNVVFTAKDAPEAALERIAEAAMKKHLGRAFPALVRRVDGLQQMLAEDPFGGFRIKPAEKRVVTFLRARPGDVPRLPVEVDGARILGVRGSEVFTVYAPGPRGPVFMTLIERTFGKDVTTRTWDTVKKVAR